MSVGGGSSDPDFLPKYIPMLFTEAELNDLVRDLNLPKNAAELLSSRLEEKNFLDKDTKTSYFRTIHEEFLLFSVMNERLLYCTGVNDWDFEETGHSDACSRALETFC